MERRLSYLQDPGSTWPLWLRLIIGEVSFTLILAFLYSWAMVEWTKRKLVGPWRCERCYLLGKCACSRRDA